MVSDSSQIIEGGVNDGLVVGGEQVWPPELKVGDTVQSSRRPSAFVRVRSVQEVPGLYRGDPVGIRLAFDPPGFGLNVGEWVTFYPRLKVLPAGRKGGLVDGMVRSQAAGIGGRLEWDAYFWRAAATAPHETEVETEDENDGQ